MATRRRYKTKADRVRAYASGGSVASAEGPPPPPPDALAEPPPEPPSHPETHLAMTRAVEAAREAEQMLHDPVAMVSRYVDSLPNLSDRQRSYLKARPVLLQPEAQQILRAEYASALAEGVPDNSDDMERRLDAGIVRQMEARRQRGMEGARAAVMHPPPEMEPSIERMAERLDAEAAGIHRMTGVENATPLILAANLPEPEPAPRRSSIPMSAPVSREIPNQAGERISPTDSRITLSPAEREIARNSYHWMSKADAEFEYAKQKAKLATMRKAGVYSE
jgi:hypothetical protein